MKLVLFCLFQGIVYFAFFLMSPPECFDWQHWEEEQIKKKDRGEGKRGIEIVYQRYTSE